MSNINIELTQTDYIILNSYINLIDGLSNYLGDGYEIVLHSLHNVEESVIKIVNGHYTGRKEGSPVTDLALSMLNTLENNMNGDHISYFSKNKKGQNMKCSTIAIRGEKKNIIGLLCINFYLDIPFSQAMASFLPPLKEVAANAIHENFVDNTDELIEKTLNEVKIKVSNDINISAINKNKEIIHLLNQKGIFNLKDSVVKVSDRMGLSKNTIYLHLRHL